MRLATGARLATLDDLSAIPGNRLEALKRDRRAAQHSHQRSVPDLLPLEG